MTTGLDLVDAIRAGRATPPSGITTLGLDGTHHWLTTVEPGHVVMAWPVDDAHMNLEGAVISVWLAALVDQALFFATQTLCADGESTRMASLRLECLSNVEDGVLTVDGRVDERVGDECHCTCELRTSDGRLAAQAHAVVDIVR